MATELTSAGLTVETLDETLTSMTDSVHAEISAELNLGSRSLDGQKLAVVARQLRQLGELALALHSARAPSTAEGEALDDVCEITGTYRRAATKSTVEATVSVDPGTYAIGTLIAYPVGAPDRRFANTTEITASGTYTFEAEVTGAQHADAGTLTVIAESVAGFNSITNAADAELGADEETDTALRRRRLDEVTRPGSATVEAIRADVLAVDGVTLCTVYENDTDATVDSIPPHAIEAVVLGGTNADILTAIFGSKAAGIQAYGSVSAAITDTQGNSHTIAFSRPTSVPIYVSMTLTYKSGLYPGDAALKQALADWADLNLSVGHDVLRARLFAEVFVAGAGGIFNVSALTLGTTASPVGTADLTMTARQLAVFDTSRIVITSTAIGGHP